MSKYSLEFPGEPVVWVKDSSALEFPVVPRAHTKGVKYDLRFPEGEEAREAKSIQGKEVQEPYAGCVAPARVFARPLAAVAALALAGVAAAAARPSAGRLRPVLAVSALAVGAVVARAVRGSRGRR